MGGSEWAFGTFRLLGQGEAGRIIVTRISLYLSLSLQRISRPWGGSDKNMPALAFTSTYQESLVPFDRFGYSLHPQFIQSSPNPIFSFPFHMHLIPT